MLNWNFAIYCIWVSNRLIDIFVDSSCLGSRKEFKMLNSTILLLPMARIIVLQTPVEMTLLSVSLFCVHKFICYPLHHVRRGLITRNVKEAVDIFHQRFGVSLLKFLVRLSVMFLICSYTLILLCFGIDVSWALRILPVHREYDVQICWLNWIKLVFL